MPAEEKERDTGGHRGDKNDQMKRVQIVQPEHRLSALPLARRSSKFSITAAKRALVRPESAIFVSVWSFSRAE